MPKRLLLLFICVALLFALTGCLSFHVVSDYDSSDLPTLPVDDKELIPLSVFTSYVEYTPPQISDDGSKILYRHAKGYQDDVIVEDWQTGDKTTVAWPHEAAGIPSFGWAPDGETVLFFVDDMGDENYGLYTSDIASGETKTILSGGTNNCYYISEYPDNDKEIYVQLMDYNRELFDLYLINYETGEKKLIMENPGEITGYIFDKDGDLKVITETDDHAGQHVYLNIGFNYDTTQFIASDWKEILAWDYEDADTSGLCGLMQDGNNLLYVDSSQSDTTTLYNYNLITGEKTGLFNDPDYDLSGTWTDLELDKVTAVSVYAQKLEWHMLDESFQDDYDVLSSVGTNFEIYDSSEEDEYWMVAYISDTKEEDYYIYDMESKQEKFLFNAQPGLEQYDFAETEPFSYIAEDGLKIEGYATFPAGAGKEDLPTVILVHGGPWARDTWEYNTEVQFLANREYLVLQVNFRGSTGYGRDFRNAGDKEWGGLMHQDIIDAVNYAVDQGWADPERVGVYGASYGGYEALVCATSSSDVFKCAVDAFGPSSLLTFVESLPPQWSVEYEDLIRSVGDPDTEADFMKSRSPLYYAEDVDIPMLIVQGENDVRVPRRESDQMVAALEEAGVSVTYMLFPDTGHGFSSNTGRQKFYSSMEEFLAENLGGKTEE